MIKSGAKISGMVHIYMYRNGTLIAERHVHNILTDAGAAHIADRMSGLTQTAMTHMAIDDVDTTPDASDTTLGSELARRTCSKAQLTGANDHKVRYTCNFPAGTGTGVVVEAGIFNASSGGTMLARVTFSELRKSSLDNITLYWDIAYADAG
jgi:phage-related tail fiber protein